MQVTKRGIALPNGPEAPLLSSNFRRRSHSSSYNEVAGRDPFRPIQLLGHDPGECRLSLRVNDNWVPTLIIYLGDDAAAFGGGLGRQDPSDSVGQRPDGETMHAVLGRAVTWLGSSARRYRPVGDQG